ncbi:hypothetical protein GW17_00040174 [Ensete ventricosum]|nr:hypothetical protein GW17_00040174 [Ensete ventricosum]
MRPIAHDSPFGESGLILPGYLSCWSNFPLRILPSGSFEDYHPLGLFYLAEQIVYCSALANTLELEAKRKERAKVAYERRKQLTKLRLKAEKTAEEKLGSQLDIFAPLKY